ncbi:DUF397 domain-containing protein [Sphaerisporangium corydalis]|uniref:DUF397 domain-containing protein n=1 Tax=Sphaerisporangium corydalis TaxID=1441875 RepID=A0ABV9EH95_9ACTN|nr:DUF397 domain-containing protein [Sphaerisporangium corydalis]
MTQKRWSRTCTNCRADKCARPSCSNSGVRTRCGRAIKPEELASPNFCEAVWRKSFRSGNNGGECVEIATNLPSVVAVRDSKNPNGPVLTLTPRAWRAFLGGVNGSQFNA